jgi:hypothetical protein
MLVVEDERPGVVGVEDNCEIVVAGVVPITVADVGVVVVAVVIAAIVVPIAVADVDGVFPTMLVVEDERPVVVGVEDDCTLVVAVVAPIAVVDVDLVVVVGAAVVDAFVAVSALAAVQVATGRLEQPHREGLVEQSCVFR